ncbi:transmembrane protein, putative [Medicago truncatula]|uniref:Transmembrane protein, putative n=1 Tax=Medicago truncatula TaxID=3880 RepID=G7IQT7_MEDTR|nr:transmembrane protein, putative [Medicago truncatula]
MSCPSLPLTCLKKRFIGDNDDLSSFILATPLDVLNYIALLIRIFILLIPILIDMNANSKNFLFSGNLFECTAQKCNWMKKEGPRTS